MPQYDFMCSAVLGEGRGGAEGAQRVMRRFDFTIIRRRVERGSYYWKLNQVLRLKNLPCLFFSSLVYFSTLLFKIKLRTLITGTV